MFQGLRQNSLFFILEKGDEVKLRIGQVVEVSNPQPKYKTFNAPQTSFGHQPEMVVDVKVKVDNETLEFKQLSANLSIENSGNVVVSDNREAMSAEVEAMLRNSKTILDSVPYHDKVIRNCDIMLRELNPQFAKEKEREETIDNLKVEVQDMKSTLGAIQVMLTEALDKGRSKKSKEE